MSEWIPVILGLIGLASVGLTVFGFVKFGETKYGSANEIAKLKEAAAKLKLFVDQAEKDRLHERVSTLEVQSGVRMFK